jgi:hypothetical protein
VTIVAEALPAPNSASNAEREHDHKLTRGAPTPQLRIHARDCDHESQIAARLRCGRDVVSQWRKRFFEQRLAGASKTDPRRGRPPSAQAPRG